MARAVETGPRVASPSESRRVEPGAKRTRRREPLVGGASLGIDATCLRGLPAAVLAGDVLGRGLEATGVRGALATGGTAGTEAIRRGAGVGCFAGLAGVGSAPCVGLALAGVGGLAGLSFGGVGALAGLGGVGVFAVVGVGGVGVAG